MMRNNSAILSMMKFCEPMARHTTFRIGGPADIWAEPEDIESLRKIVQMCRRDRIPVLVVGKGSNLLVKDSGFRGCILNLNREAFKGIKIGADTVKAGAGLELPRLLNILCENGLAGLEFLAGIPATVGGALVTNAGGKYSRQSSVVSRQIGDFVEEVTVMDKDGHVIKLNKNEIAFRYRGSNLEKYIVLSARLKLLKSDKEKVSSRMKEYLKQKRARQELDKPSAGCVFKNPQAGSAGKFIDTAGLKGKRIGDAVVSTKHANFIINAGNATCNDVLNLMELVRKKIKKDYGIALKEEIKILG